MSATHDFDAITVDALRGIGGLKWSMFPEHVGAFVAEMDFGIAGPITAAISAGTASGFFGYLPPSVGAAMGQACSEYYRSNYGWEVPAGNIRPLADVLAGLQAAMEHFSPAGSKIVLPTPAYMPFFKLPGLAGREIIEVPMVRTGESWEMDYAALEQAFVDGGGLLIMCNPHNPIGKVYTVEEMVRIADIVARHGGRVFSDEIHGPLVFPGAVHVPYASVSEAAARHTITATSASKAWNIPGLKTAQLILSNAADVEVWDKVGLIPEHGASNPGVAANIAAYTGGAPWLDGVVEYLDGNRRLLGELVAEHLPGVGYLMPQGTYLALLDCRGLGLGDHPSEFFFEHAGIAFTDGADCAASGQVRINFATPRPILEDIILRMKAALAEHGSTARELVESR
ncbi:MalY/PatB family protein [Pseudarthrobacter sp. P1]|uniref:MalY/PatB family protein n=1 Tax=Pseudarthrobacter sp. P1 TaxID=3418418 RepID=UPI003CEA6AAA